MLATANLYIFDSDQRLNIEKVLSYASSPQLRHLHRRSRSWSQSRTEAVEGGDSSGSFSSTMEDVSSGGGGGGTVHTDDTTHGSALAIVKLKRQMLELQRKKEAEEKEAKEKQFALMMEELDVMEAAAGSGVPLDVLESMGMMKLGSIPPPSLSSHSPPVMPSSSLTTSHSPTVMTSSSLTTSHSLPAMTSSSLPLTTSPPPFSTTVSCHRWAQRYWRGNVGVGGRE